jgi:hypothetical protein
MITTIINPSVTTARRYSSLVRHPSHYVCLAAPGVGPLQGTLCANRRSAAEMLGDRQENGEAFPGEFVCCVPRRARPRALGMVIAFTW